MDPAPSPQEDRHEVSNQQEGADDQGRREFLEGQLASARFLAEHGMSPSERRRNAALARRLKRLLDALDRHPEHDEPSP